jgi:hypothetical protein
MFCFGSRAARKKSECDIREASAPYCPWSECHISPMSSSPLSSSSSFTFSSSSMALAQYSLVAPAPSSFCFTCLTAHSTTRVHHLFHRRILPRHATLRHLGLEIARPRTRTLERFRPRRRNRCYCWYAACGRGGRYCHWRSGSVYGVCAVRRTSRVRPSSRSLTDYFILLRSSSHIPSVHTQSSIRHRPGAYQSSFLPPRPDT